MPLDVAGRQQLDRLAYQAECLVADTYGLPRTGVDRPDDGKDFLLPAFAAGVAVDRGGVYALVATAELRGTKAGRWASAWLDADDQGGGGTCRVNVKWTPHDNGGLYHAIDEPRLALAYVLVTGPEGAMEIRGFAWRRTLEAAKVTDKGYGPGFYLRQDELHRTDLLMAAHGLVRKA